MNKRIGIITVLIGMVGSTAVEAITTRLQTPLWGYYWTTYHYPLDPIQYENEDKKFFLDVMQAYYARSADKAYFHGCNIVDEKGCQTSTQQISALFFGKECFRGEEIFEGGTLAGRDSGIPALTYAKLCPRFDYNEKGLFLGLHMYHEIGEERNWRIGMRWSVPLKVVEVEQSRSCGTERFEESLADVRALREEWIDEENVDSFVRVIRTTWAYRLDFLSSLQLNGTPLVVFGNGAGTPTKVAGITISSDDPTSPLDRTPAFALGRTDGTIPDQTITFYGADDSQAGALPANGTIANNERRYFAKTGQDYAANLANDRDAQSKIFITPVSVGDDDPNNNPDNRRGNLILGADTILNVVEHVLNGLEATGHNSAEQFFKDNCLYLCRSYREFGPGDLDIDAYGGYHDDEKYADLLVGLRVPTGKRNQDVRNMLSQPLGNNGHLELEVGTMLGWSPIEWFGWTADAYFAHAFKREEKRAAPFKGATVRNIGSAIDVETTWNYVVAHTDITFFHPKTRNTGLSLGYEFYNKFRDKVSLCRLETCDLLGETHELDPSILECNSDMRSHKIRGGVFHRCGYGEIFLGASQVFSGDRAMKETEWHIGFDIYF